MGILYGSGMREMGEGRATPDVAEPVNKSPSASSASYDVAPPLPRESVAGKPWKEAGRSHTAAAARVEASSSTVARIMGVHRGSQARRLRERAKAARHTARALAPVTGQPSLSVTKLGGPRTVSDHRLSFVVRDCLLSRLSLLWPPHERIDALRTFGVRRELPHAGQWRVRDCLVSPVCRRRAARGGGLRMSLCPSGACQVLSQCSSSAAGTGRDM